MNVLDVFYIKKYYEYDMVPESKLFYNDEDMITWLEAIDYMIQRVSDHTNTNYIYSRIPLTNHSFIVNCVQGDDNGCDKVEFKNAIFKPYVRRFKYHSTSAKFEINDELMIQSHFVYDQVAPKLLETLHCVNVLKFKHFVNHWNAEFDDLKSKNDVVQYILLSVPQYVFQLRDFGHYHGEKEFNPDDNCFYRGNQSMKDMSRTFTHIDFIQHTNNGKRILSGVVENLVHVNNKITYLELDRIINISLFCLNLELYQILEVIEERLITLYDSHIIRDKKVGHLYGFLINKVKMKLSELDTKNSKNIELDPGNIDDFCITNNYEGLLRYLNNISLQNKYYNPLNIIINHILNSDNNSLILKYVKMMNRLI